MYIYIYVHMYICIYLYISRCGMGVWAGRLGPWVGKGVWAGRLGPWALGLAWVATMDGEAHTSSERACPRPLEFVCVSPSIVLTPPGKSMEQFLFHAQFFRTNFVPKNVLYFKIVEKPLVFLGCWGIFYGTKLCFSEQNFVPKNTNFVPEKMSQKPRKTNGFQRIFKYNTNRVTTFVPLCFL